MGELGFHLRLSLEDGRVIASTTAQQRVLAHAVLVAGRKSGLLAARAANNHLHLAVMCSRPLAGGLLRGVAASLRHRLALPCRFARSHVEPIRDQRELYSTFWNVLRNDERHAIDLDPWAEASNLPDLLGLRRIGRYTVRNVARALPRVRVGELVSRLGLTRELLERGTISRAALEQLGDATAATVAAPTIRGRTPELVAARRAAVRLVGREVSPSRLAELLDTTTRTIRRARTQRADPAMVEAIARQLRLRTVWAARAAAEEEAKSAEVDGGMILADGLWNCGVGA